MTYEIDDTDMENLRDAAVSLDRSMRSIGLAPSLRANLQQARDLIGVTLSRAGRHAVGEDAANYTMAEAAQFKGVSYHTVSRAVRRKRLTHHRIGRQVLIASADLMAWRPMVERRP